VADVVAPLIYAIAGTDSAALLRDYKNHPSRAVRRRRSDEIASLLGTALTLHQGCLGRAAGMPVDVSTTIPSLSFRPGPHPFAELARDVTEVTQDLLMPGPITDCHRVVSLGKFSVSRADVVAGRHVLVLDDIWTTGSNAQSASLALRAAGAAAVSVLVIGRWLNPSYPPTKAFLARPPDSTPGCAP
jgi:phosphoribosylpyrophosphate synthetase